MKAAAAAALAAVLACSPSVMAAEKKASTPQPPLQGIATPIDGNTVMIDGRTVRLFGIDVMEMRDPNGAAARGVLDDLVRGYDVVCALREKGRHIGAVAVCKIGMTDLAQGLLRSGYATVNRLDTANTDFASLYDAAELEARRAGLGIWMPQPEPEPARWSAAWVGAQLWDLPNGVLLILIAAVYGGRQLSRRHDVPGRMKALYALLRQRIPAKSARVTPPAE
jgi:endonuclease YncB( thermonuclease family)